MTQERFTLGRTRRKCTTVLENGKAVGTLTLFDSLCLVNGSFTFGEDVFALAHVDTVELGLVEFAKMVERTGR
jgi:hypothetical protein